MREFNEDDLLTLEVRVHREGVLDRDAALELIEAHREKLGAYESGYEDGFEEAKAQARNGEDL